MKAGIGIGERDDVTQRGQDDMQDQTDNGQQPRGHHLYDQALRALDKAGPETAGYSNQEEKQSLAGALALQAAQHGPPMPAIHEVVASRTNNNLFAVYVNPGNREDVMRAHVDRTEAVHRPAGDSLSELHEISRQSTLARGPDDPSRGIVR